MDDVVKEAISYLEKQMQSNQEYNCSDLLLKLYRSMDLTAEYNALKTCNFHNKPCNYKITGFCLIQRFYYLRLPTISSGLTQASKSSGVT
jgi:hypothetical protein